MGAIIQGVNESQVYSRPMTRCRRFSAVLALTMLLMPLAAFAQQFTSSSSSESTFVTQDREFRLRGFAESLEKAAVIDAQFRSQRAEYYSVRTQKRRDCRADIRAANKTTLLPVLVQCERTELNDFREFLAQQRVQLEATAGIVPFVRADALRRLDALSDAMKTIIFAIDSGVYGSKEELLEGKINLYAKYEFPFWDAWMSVRVDRTLTWIAHVIAKIDVLRQQESAKGLDRAALRDARACLVSEEESLHRLTSPGQAKDRSEKIGPILMAVQDCVHKIQKIPRALTESGTLLPSP